MIDNAFKSKCRSLIQEYDQILNRIIEEETVKLSQIKIGDSEFEIVKSAIYNAGMREGMRRLVAKINEHAK